MYHFFYMQLKHQPGALHFAYLRLPAETVSMSNFIFKTSGLNVYSSYIKLKFGIKLMRIIFNAKII
jgi:hypothetical protein